MKIVVSGKKKAHEYYDVPPKIAKAVIVLLEECGNTDTEIISAEADADDTEVTK